MVAVPPMVSPTITGFFHLRSEKPRPPIEAMVLRKAVAEHAQRQRRGLPAGGGEAAEQRGFRGFLVEVEREGIELAREGDDHLLADGGVAEVDDFADGEVLVVPAVGGDGIHGG